MNRIAVALVLSSALLGQGIVMAQEPTPNASDNSAVNVRDRDAGAVTAGQQSSAKSDVELTRKIRRAVSKDKSLSMMAHNVKIISADGNVTLRGPVNTEEEKTTVGRIAEAIAGADKIDNQIDVKNQ